MTFMAEREQPEVIAKITGSGELYRHVRDYHALPTRRLSRFLPQMYHAVQHANENSIMVTHEHQVFPAYTFVKAVKKVLFLR